MAIDWRGAATYPVRGPATELPLVATWALVLATTLVPVLPFVPALGLVVPGLALVALVGYLARVLVASVAGEPAPRFLRDGETLLRRGIGGTVLCVCYLIVPILLLIVTVYGAVWTGGVAAPSAFDTITIYAGSTVVLILSLLGAYVLPIALLHYADRGRLRAGFDRGFIRATGLNGAYFAGWVAGAATLMVGTGIALSIAGVHRAGPIPATLLLAYVLLVVVHTWGRAMARAR